MDSIKRFFRQQRGLTLLELVVVLSILAVIASIVAPAVSGQTTRGRGSAKGADLQSVQTAADNYGGDAPANSGGTVRYPVNAFPADAYAGMLPSSTVYHAKIGTTYYFKPLMLAGQSTDTEFVDTDTGATKYFVPTYLKKAPKHATDTVNASGENASGTVVFTGETLSFAGGKDFSAGADPATASAPTAIGVWVVDQNGIVRVLLNDSAY